MTWRVGCWTARQTSDSLAFVDRRTHARCVGKHVCGKYFHVSLQVHYYSGLDCGVSGKSCAEDIEAPTEAEPWQARTWSAARSAPLDHASAILAWVCIGLSLCSTATTSGQDEKPADRSRVTSALRGNRLLLIAPQALSRCVGRIRTPQESTAAHRSLCRSNRCSTYPLEWMTPNDSSDISIHAVAGTPPRLCVAGG